MKKSCNKNKITKKNKQTRKKRGAGGLDVLRKYTIGEKRKELVSQAKSIYDGFREGYGIGGIGGWTDFAWDNGSNEYLVTVRLSDIILWHPVRGPGERAQAGEKTTTRANSMYDVLMNSISTEKNPSLPTVTFSSKNPLTYNQLNKVNDMQSDDTVKICPVNISTNINAADKELIDNLSEEIVTLNKNKNLLTKTKTISTKTTTIRSRAINHEIEQKQKQLQNLLYKNEEYRQYFLVLSGQGRLQAIIEAVKKANIPPDTFYIRLTCKNIYLDICNVLLKIHNTWVEKGDFDDERHEVYIDGNYIPMKKVHLAFSCSRNRNKLDTLCYAEYNSGAVPSQNMGCSTIYDYTKRIPLSRIGMK
jgi:hypothetical protein